MKPTRFRAVRALSSKLAVAAAATLALGFAPACKKDTESKQDTTQVENTKANQAANAAAAPATAPTKVVAAKTEGSAPAPAPAKAGDEAPPAAPQLGVSKTLKNTAKVAIAPTKAVPAKVGGAADKAVPTGKAVKRETDTHIVQVFPPSTVASGKEGVVKVTLLPKKGWKINQDFPTSLKITAPSGVTVAKQKLRKGDAASFGEKKAEFHVKFNASAAGAKSFSAKFKFAMCTEETCDPKKEVLAWKVDVK